MPIAEDSAGGSPVPVPTDLTTNLTGQATGSGTLDYTTGDIDIVVTVVDNGHNHILDNITDVQVNNAISGQVLKYNGNVWVNGTDENAGITAIVQDTTPQLGGNLDLNNRNITGTGNIAITGTIDGRDVSADGTKLDGIESGATADQTAAQIKTAYESNADTNAFTDADHTKLDGIETAADVTDTTNVVASLTAGTNVTIAADGTISATGGTSGIAHVVDDTTPQLGGNLDLNSNDITGTGNLNFTGSVTLSGTVDGRDVAADGTKLDGIEASADVTDTANVTAAGALMDSEVTNLAQVKAFDSSDYATAAQGTTADAALPKAGGTMTGDILFNDNVKAKFGTGDDLIISHNGSNSIISNSTGFLDIRSDTVHIDNAANNEKMAQFTADGSVDLYYDNAKKLETTSTGIDVTGVTKTSGSGYNPANTGWVTNAALITSGSYGGGLTFIDGSKGYSFHTLSGGEVLTIKQGATSGALTEKLRIDANGLNVTGNIDLPDNGKLLLGASDDLQIYHSGGASWIKDEGTGQLNITTNGTDIRLATNTSEKMLVAKPNQSVELYYDNTKKLETTSSGIDVTGNVDLPDNGKLLLGASDDLQLFHDGTHNWIRDVGTGALFLDTNSAIHLYANGSENMLYAQPNAGVQVFYDNVKKLETTSTGIDVTGNVNATASLTFGSGGAYEAGSIYSDANWGMIHRAFTASPVQADHLFVNSAGTERMRIDSGGLDVTGDIGLSSTQPTITLTDTDGPYSTAIAKNGSVLTVDGDSVRIRSDSGTEYMRVTSNGIDVTGTVVADKMFVEGTANSRQWEAGSAGQKLAIYAYDNSTFYHRLETGNATNYQWGTYDNIPIYTITNNSIKTTLLADGKFGVGTTAPKARTQITSGGYATPSLGSVPANASLYVSPSDTAYGLVVGMDNVTPRTWLQSQHTNGASVAYALTLQEAGGNVGIGHTSPVAKMAILGSSNSTITEANSNLCVEGSGGNGMLFGTLSTTGFKSYIQSGFVSNLGTATYALALNPLGGNVGIGTTTCADKLHVEGNIYLGTSSRSVYTGGGGDLRLQTNTGEVKLLTANGATTNLITSGTGINIPNNLDVGNALNVGGASPAGSGFIESTVVGSSRALQTVGSVNTTQTHIGFENLYGEIGRIDVSAFSVAYVTSSDYRLKTDIQPMQGSIDRVKALKPVNFEWKEEGTRVDGFLAHEAQEVVPEAISGEKDAMRDQQYVESEATGDIYTPAVEATYETIQVELTPAVEAVYETVTVEISPAVEATYDEEGNELTPAVEAVTEEQEQLVTPAVDATYEEQQQELTPAVDEVIHSSDVVEPDTLEEGQLWRQTTEKVMATRQVPDYQGIDQSKIVPLLTSALQDAIAKIEALETRLEALES